jgi:hypothetical protein
LNGNAKNTKSPIDPSGWAGEGFGIGFCGVGGVGERHGVYIVTERNAKWQCGRIFEFFKTIDKNILI